jgi:hypothetical protein
MPRNEHEMDLDNINNVQENSNLSQNQRHRSSPSQSDIDGGQQRGTQKESDRY